MKKAIMKIMGKRGESLLESMVAILIFSMASIAMFSMFSAANKTNATVKAKVKTMSDQLVSVEQGQVPSAPIQGQVTISFGRTKLAESSVYIFGDPQNDELYTYFKKP